MNIDHIHTLTIVGGLLDGTRIAFDPGLNCIIGARGTGKTTLAQIVARAAGGDDDCIHEINASSENGVDAARRSRAGPQPGRSPGWPRIGPGGQGGTLGGSVG